MLIVGARSAGSESSMRRAWRQPSRRTQRPIGTISPVSSASGMNWSGAIEPALGMAPAQQRLDAGDAAVLRRTTGW